MARIKTIKRYDVTTESFPITINLASKTQRYKIAGTKTLSTDVAITYTGTPAAGMSVELDWYCSITPGAYKITVFGKDIPAAFVTKKLKIICDYNGSWEVYFLWDVSTWTGAAGSVVFVGNTGVEPLDAKGSGNILVGSGTTVQSVPVSGDVTMSSAGAVAIGAQKVLASMLGLLQIANAHISATAAILFTKMAALTASKIPVLNASGFIEAGTVDASKLSYINVTTAGTAEASKAIVVDASKKINELDITALKLNGTSITATPAQINYLANVNSDLQTQIDAGIAKVSQTTLSGDTTATAANLKSLYFGDTTGGAVVFTLPVASTVVIGTPVRLVHVDATNAFSVTVQGSDNLFDVTDLSTDISTKACGGAGKGLELICISATSWQVIRVDA